MGVWDWVILNIEPERVMEWRDELLDHVKTLLHVERQVGDHCVLLQTLGALHLVPNIASRDELITHNLINNVLSAWSQLVELIPDAPLFPIR